MNHSGLAMLCGLVVGTFAYQSACYSQGPLTPPGAPAPTMKTLDQVEPRTVITNLPYTITQPGSYYLTTNLTGIPFNDGITVLANNVTIDLNGFALIAPVGSSGTGITESFAIDTNVTVRNGSVIGWGSEAVELGYACRIEHVRASGISGATALLVREESVVSDCTVVRCNAGIGTQSGCRVSQCVVSFNNNGITVGDGCVVSGCTMDTNVANGISAGIGCTLSGSTARGNGLHGIVAGAATTISGCTASSSARNGIQVGDNSLVNGCTASSNTGTGIVAASGCMINGCMASGNGGVGVLAVQDSTVVNCTARQNLAGGIRVTANCVILNNNASNNGTGSTGDGIKTIGINNRIDSNHTVANHGTGVNSTGSVSGDYIVRNTAFGNTVSNYNPSASAYFGPFSTPGATNATPWSNF